jgi:uncharacterized protein
VEGQTGRSEVIDRLIADFQERELPRVTRRDLSLPGLPGKADVVVGMRRSGKTWFVYQQIADRLASGIDRERLLYLNFEDERLLPLTAADLSRIPEAFYRRSPANREQLCWFFFDEIQNAPGWETFIRRLLETEKVALVLTGSSARLLSREIATSLRGRSLSTEILPFSFAETLRHQGVERPERWPPGTSVTCWRTSCTWSCCAGRRRSPTAQPPPATKSISSRRTGAAAGSWSRSVPIWRTR